MPAKLTFETAAFADAIKKASIVAPTTGAAFDKAGGIMLEIDPSGKAGWTCLVRTTDLDIFRIEWVDPIEIEGDAERWLLPSRTFAPTVASLAIGSGKTVVLESGTSENGGPINHIRLTSQRRNVRFNLIDPLYYPNWEIFDPSQLSEAQDIGGRISQVSWAAAKSGEPLNGIHFTGEVCAATNQHKLAIAPLVIPNCPHPFTIPNGCLPQLLRQTGDVKIGISSGAYGDQLLLVPDEQTQLRCITYGHEYPSRATKLDPTRPNTIKLKKGELTTMMGTANTYASSDREAPIQLYLGREEIAVISENKEVGLFRDIVEVPGQAIHPRVKINFDPGYIMDAFDKAPNEEVIIGYDVERLNAPIHIDGGSGYQCWVSPRAQARPESKEGSS